MQVSSRGKVACERPFALEYNMIPTCALHLRSCRAVMSPEIFIRSHFIIEKDGVAILDGEAVFELHANKYHI